MNSLGKVTGGFSRAGQSSYAYDKNGNLTELVRWAMDGTGSPELIDAFEYHYAAGTNRLTYITDAETTSTATNDLKDQNPDNYGYNLNGQLTADERAGRAPHRHDLRAVLGAVREVEAMTEHPPELIELARRLVWFKPPEETLAWPALLAAHFYEYGTWDDWGLLRRHWGDDRLRDLMAETPPGIVGPRSWNWWNLVYRPEAPLPLPVRRIPG